MNTEAGPSVPRTPSPSWLKALGRRPLPERIEVAGVSFVWSKTYKNDFFAVTALYRNVDRGVILKAHRQASCFGIPLRWIGRWLARREAAAFRQLQGIEGIPAFLGFWEDTGILHEFVPGHVLRKGERVDDHFHDRLRAVIDAIHVRDMAYVDLEKCENVLVGDDGRPYLVDFQIAFRWPWRIGARSRPVRWLLRRFQASDVYHLGKLKRRTRPDLMTPAQREASYARPWYVRLHGMLSRPLRWMRRRILDAIDPGRRPGERGRLEG